MDKMSIARLVSLIVALLAYFNINIPSSVEEAVVSIAVSVIVLYTAWKNNSITKEAREADEYMRELKEQKKQGK